MRREQLLETPLNLSMRDELGQTFFIAVLGGFRSVVASLTELQTIKHWQYSNWGVVDELFVICTKLQPREEHYWETRAQHLAANARDSYLFHFTLTEASRTTLAQQFVEKGIAVLREGVERIPQSWKLLGPAGVGQLQLQSKPGLRSGLPLLQQSGGTQRTEVLLPPRGAGTGQSAGAGT